MTMKVDEKAGRPTAGQVDAAVPELRLADIEIATVHASERSNWVFMTVTSDSGHTGVGEATLDGHEQFVVDYLEAMRPLVVGGGAADILRACEAIPGAPSNRVYAAAASGLEQALWDLSGKQLGVPVYRLLGGKIREGIRAYANINKGTRGDRSPAGFATSAERAVASGATAVKCAPFDGVWRQNLIDRDAREAIAVGVERVQTVRDAVGSEVDVLVDCHWRFDVRTALQVLGQLEASEPFWVEALVPETDLAGWEKIRARTTARLAGGEMTVGLEDFRRFIDASGVDVIMPDVKWAGGISGLMKVATLAEAFGISCAPHNPSGPVATLASLHACVSANSAVMLEFSWGEAGWRSDLVGFSEDLRGGLLHPSASPGLGITLNLDVIAENPPTPTTLAERPEYTGHARSTPPSGSVLGLPLR